MKNRYEAEVPQPNLEAATRWLSAFLDASQGRRQEAARRAAAAFALAEMIDQQPLMLPTPGPLPVLDAGKCWEEAGDAISTAIGTTDNLLLACALGRAADALREAEVPS